MGSRDDKYNARKEASRRANEREQAKQNKLRREQQGKNPPKMSRDDIKRAKRMPGGRPGDRD